MRVHEYRDAFNNGLSAPGASARDTAVCIVISGCVSLIAQHLYGLAYTNDPSKCGAGSMLSMLQTLTLIISVMLRNLMPLV